MGGLAGSRCARRWPAGLPSSRAAVKTHQDIDSGLGETEDTRWIHDEAELKKAYGQYPAHRQLKEKYEKDRRQVDESYQQTKATTQEQYKQTWDKLIKDWTEGMARVSGVIGDVRDEAGRRFLEWHRPDLDGWKPPTEVPPGLRFGAFNVDLDQFPGGSPRDPRLKSVPTQFELPALLPFPIHGSVLIKAADSGKDEAILLLPDAPLLTCWPAGKGYTIAADPVGLGENFAAGAPGDDTSDTNRI